MHPLDLISGMQQKEIYKIYNKNPAEKRGLFMNFIILRQKNLTASNLGFNINYCGVPNTNIEKFVGCAALFSLTNLTMTLLGAV